MREIFFAVGLVSAGLTIGAAADKPTEQEPILVIASRIGDAAEDMPSSVHIYTAAEVARSGARDLPEFLEKSANLHVRTLNANPLQAQIAMRGFGENSFGRVKVIVDGEELNSVELEAPNLARVPLAIVERIEVVSGASPVLYGDGAVAGVINVTTRAHDYGRKTRVAVKGGSYGMVGARLTTRGGFEEEALVYSASYDFTRSDGYRARSAYDLQTVVGTLRKSFDNGSAVGLSANYFNALYQMPGALSWIEWKSDPRQAVYRHDWSRLWNAGVTVDSKIALGDERWILVDAGFSDKHRMSNWGDAGSANVYDLLGFQLAPRYVDEGGVGDLDGKSTLGLDFRCDWYATTDRSVRNDPRGHFGRVRSALYGQEELSLMDEISALAGVRVEAIGNRWSRRRSLSETASRDLMGDCELGLVYRPVENLKIYAKGARFHRSASCDELTCTGDGRFLDPETGASLDLGTEFSFADEFKFDFVGYWMVMEDEIFYNPYAMDYGGYWGGFNCNSPGRTERLGLDTGLSWLRDKVAEASVRSAFVSSRFCSGPYAGRSIPLVPESRARAEIGVWIFDDLEVMAGCRFVASQVLAGDFWNDHLRLGCHTAFDLSIRYNPSWAPGWEATVAVDNLLDDRHCDFAGWSDYAGVYCYPASGRSFLITVRYEF